MKRLLSATWVLASQLLFLQGSREVYVLFALHGAAAFVIGMVVGSIL